MIIDEELGVIQAQLCVNKTMMEKEINRAIGRLAKELQKSELKIYDLNLKLTRKEAIIKQLQASLKKVFKERDALENKLKNVDLAEMNKNKLEMDELREEIKKLKAKNKEKARKIRQYKLLLEDIIPDEYEEDPDEEDGVPSEDSSGAEDIEMVDKEALLNDEESDVTDPEDSEFELDEEDKAKMKKDEKKTDEAAEKAGIKKKEGAERVEIKDDEEEEAERDGAKDGAKRDEAKDAVGLEIE